MSDTITWPAPAPSAAIRASTKTVRVDPAKRAAWAGGGATASDHISEAPERVLRRVRDVAETKAEQVEAMPSPARQSAFDDPVPNCWRSGLRHRTHRRGDRGSRRTEPRAGDRRDLARPCRRRGRHKWVRDHRAAVHPHSGSEGGCIDFMSGNVFHVNQNIAPANGR